jgi:hypothetical protein
VLISLVLTVLCPVVLVEHMPKGRNRPRVPTYARSAATCSILALVC